MLLIARFSTTCWKSKLQRRVTTATGSEGLSLKEQQHKDDMSTLASNIFDSSCSKAVQSEAKDLCAPQDMTTIQSILAKSTLIAQRLSCALLRTSPALVARFNST